MEHGFDLTTFRLSRQERPAWAGGTTSSAPDLEPREKERLQEQMPAIFQKVEDVLHWAFLEEEGIAALQLLHPYANNVPGDYFIGRQYIERSLDKLDSFIIETEVCLTRPDSKQFPSIYHRYIVVLEWSIDLKEGSAVFARQMNRECYLATLHPQLVKTFELPDVADLSFLSPDSEESFRSLWLRMLDLSQRAAIDIIESSTSSGQLNDTFFPERVVMTGEYYIGSISEIKSDSGKSFFLTMLRFLEHPFVAGQERLDYLGYDFSVDIGEQGELTYELWGSQSI